MFNLHDPLTAQQVLAAVEAADNIDLVRALVEPDDYDGRWPAMDENAFYCPMCQARRLEWLMSGPAALFVGDLTWKCRLCDVEGTRWTLQRQVLESPSALTQFVSWLVLA